MPFTFADLDKLDSGARFYTADLHVHTYGGSADVKDPTCTVEAILDAAAAAGLGLVSITDHNNDKHVLTSLTYGAKYADRLLVVPGVEISTAHGHLLVYGDPSKPETIGVLLARIGLEGPKGDRDTHTTKSMADVISEADKLGLLSIAAHIDRGKTGFETLADGYPNWKKDILMSPGLYGLDFDDPAHLVWFSSDDEAGDAGGQRRAIARQREQKLGHTGRPILAAVQNSDAHALDHFTAALLSKTLTRYKMTELTFEGLRTALTDPESRVRPKAMIPSSLPRIRGIHVTAGFLDGEIYRFSDNLNTFIGGRGTGKSTAIQSLAYGLGLADSFASQGNCPDSVIVFCEDATGVLYRYERQKGGSAVAKSKLGKGVQEVPLDSFRVEFYRQGELAEVAKDPLKNPTLLQSFLDRHLTLSDLRAKQDVLLEELRNNSGELIPLETAAQQLAQTQKALQEVEQKLDAAKEGKLQELAELQGKIAAEKALVQGIRDFAASFEAGLVFDRAKKDFDALRSSVGAVTGDAECEAAFQAAKEVVGAANQWIKEQQDTFNLGLKGFGSTLRQTVGPVPQRHSAWDDEIAKKSEQLRAQGLSGGLAQLNRLLELKATHIKTIARLTEQQPTLVAARLRRAELLAALAAVRNEVAERRKGQVHTINQSFKETIEDYSIYLFYEPSGICDEFLATVLDVMQGTYFQQKPAEKLCRAIDPSMLATLVSGGDAATISTKGGVDLDWAQQLVLRFAQLPQLHRLQVTDKPPCPTIRVLTKSVPQIDIPVNELSDGQKHTILLTIAMLAESNDPLIIDQPEDDLDNAFIFRSVVKTLRYIKERRQVIVVTHNANIAVLGDSELIFPMRQEGVKGRAFERGAIDRGPTKQAVQDVLEGGTTAFLRRKAIYGV